VCGVGGSRERSVVAQLDGAPGSVVGAEAARVVHMLKGEEGVVEHDVGSGAVHGIAGAEVARASKQGHH